MAKIPENELLEEVTKTHETLKKLPKEDREAILNS